MPTDKARQRWPCYLAAINGQGNKLSLNILKTQAIVVGSCPNFKKISTRLVEPPSFSIGGSEVEMVDNVKYLEVQIDRRLACDEHIHFVPSKSLVQLDSVNMQRS